MQLVQRLIRRGSIPAADLARISEAHFAAPAKPLHELLIERGFAKEDDVLIALAEEFGMELVDLTQITVEPATLQAMPLKLVHRRSLMPLSRNNGTLVVATNLTTSSSVTIAGGQLQLPSNGTYNRVIISPSVTTPGGTIDLADNKMIVGGLNYASVQTQVATGHNGGGWNGATGILTSQTAAQGITPLTTLAVAMAGDVGYGGAVTFDGQTVNGTDTLVMYTYAGDTNLDGQINGDDYFRMDNGFPGNAATYENGDLNYDGVINADDYFIIDKNYGNQTLGVLGVFPHAPLPGGVSAVPEPAGLAIVGFALAMATRRRRARQH